MYSPKISSTLIPTLYRMAREQKVPMTKIVNGIIGKEVLKFKRKERKNGNSNA